MNKLISFFSFLLITTFVLAQCHFPIPSSAVPIKSSAIITIEDTSWICEGLDISVNRVYNTLYVEKNCTTNVSADFCLLYVRGPGVVGLYGDSITLIYAANVQVLDNGTGNTINVCSAPITFDYTNAPGNGCVMPPSGIENNMNLFSIHIHPNPAKDLIYIENEQYLQLIEYQIYNIEGKLSQSGSFSKDNDQIDVSSQPKGVYFIRILTSKGTNVNRMLIQ